MENLASDNVLLMGGIAGLIGSALGSKNNGGTFWRGPVTFVISNIVAAFAASAYPTGSPWLLVALALVVFGIVGSLLKMTRIQIASSLLLGTLFSFAGFYFAGRIA